MIRQSLKFHIKLDDYFGTLATVLSLIQQKKWKIKNVSMPWIM